jgi:hypothetical protein
MSAVIMAAVLAALGYAQAAVSRLQGTTRFAVFIQRGGGEQNHIRVGGRKASSDEMLRMENPFLGSGNVCDSWAAIANGENRHRGVERFEQSQLIGRLA